MPVTVQEKWESRNRSEGDHPEVELIYLAHGTSDDQEAIEAVDAAAPSSYQGLLKRNIQLTPIGPSDWVAVVRYDLARGSDPGEREIVEWDADTTGGTMHIQVALAETRYVASGYGDVPMDGLINVTEDGQVEGLDIVAPAFRFSFKRRYTMLDFAAVKLWASYTGWVNADVWRSFAPGEVLFLGVNVQADARGSVVTFHFSGSQNAVNFNLGGVFGISKAGWDYLWVRTYERLINGQRRKFISHVYVDQVYPRVSFTGLGL